MDSQTVGESTVAFQKTEWSPLRRQSEVQIRISSQRITIHYSNQEPGAKQSTLADASLEVPSFEDLGPVGA